MYIKKIVKFLKIKNAVLFAAGVFLIATTAANMVSLITYYWGDWETVVTARSTPESVILFFVGIFLLVWAFFSQNMIHDAYFYSSYFEGSLDEDVEYRELNEITGRSAGWLKFQLHIFKIIYMKNYSFKTEADREHVELYSKKYTCECRTCGAPVNKSEYFTGTCHYCGSSDVFAKVITGNRLYSISNQISDDRKKPEFYSSKSLKSRKALFLSFLCLGLTVFFIAFIACIDNIANYNNQDYLTEVLLSGKSYSSFALIKAEILDTVIWLAMLIIAVLPLILAMLLRLKHIFITESCSAYFAKCKRPFVNVASLPAVKKKKHGIKSVKAAICRHYLLNCTFEKHDDELKIALARKIVKDECPSCGASIVGAVDENYKCKYCGNTVMNVILKK